MKIAAIVQARFGSSRLPGKVLLPLGTRSVLEHVVDRAKAISGVDEVVVATSTAASDDAVAAAARVCGAAVFRGSEDDVLGRYVGAALAALADAVVRITADCPLLDPFVAAPMVRRFREANATGRLDYLSNGTSDPTFPRGLDVEIVRRDVLEEADREARDASEREHVTLFVYRRPERFSIETFERPGDNLGHMRWTLDEPDDYAFLQAVVKLAGKKIAEDFSHGAVLDVLAEHPELASLNAHVRQKRA